MSGVGAPCHRGRHDPRPLSITSVSRVTCEDTTMADEDDLTGHMLRMAQERRLIRFCAEMGIDPNSPDIDDPALNLLAPILDAAGEIIPEPEDIEAARRG